MLQTIKKCHNNLRDSIVVLKVSLPDREKALYYHLLANGRAASSDGLSKKSLMADWWIYVDGSTDKP